MEPRSLGVLETALARGMTTRYRAGSSRPLAKRAELEGRGNLDLTSFRTRMCRRAHSRCFLAERGGWLSGQGRQHKRNHVAEAFILGLLRQKVATENHAERCTVGEIEKAQRR